MRLLISTVMALVGTGISGLYLWGVYSLLQYAPRTSHYFSLPLNEQWAINVGFAAAAVVAPVLAYASWQDVYRDLRRREREAQDIPFEL